MAEIKNFKEWLKKRQASPFYYFIKNTDEFQNELEKHDEAPKTDKEKTQDDDKAILNYMLYHNRTQR